MKRLACLATSVFTAAVGLFAQPPDASRVLADMRQALGGDAAIGAVRAISVDGIETRTIADHAASANVEFVCLLPDRCIKVRRIPDPPGGDTVETYGFNGDAHIRRRASTAFDTLDTSE